MSNETTAIPTALLARGIPASVPRIYALLATETGRTGYTQTQLANELGYHRSVVWEALAILEDHGYLRTEASKTDGRSSVITLATINDEAA